MIGPWFADNLQGDRHGAVVKSDRNSNGGKAEHIDEPRPVTEFVQRFGIERCGARVALDGERCSDRNRRQDKCFGIPKNVVDEIHGQL